MEIKLNQDNVLAAYKNASKEQKELLEHLFGSEIFTSKTVTERIKTFDDCLDELGENNPLVEAYFNVDQDDVTLHAFCKLRIIAAALNEGWQPTFAKGERRWYPWFSVLTPEQYNQLSKEDKSRVVGRAYFNSGAHGGLAYENANCASSGAYTNCGSRPAFKNEKLAIYAGTQFGEIYADFILG